MRMNNKMGLITGAASGLGYESAKLLAEEGAAVLICDIDSAGGEKAAQEIRDAGGTALFQFCDVSKESDIVEAISKVRSEWGGFDFIHNNAGIQLEKTILDTSNEEWDAINTVNLKAVFWEASMQ